MSDTVHTTCTPATEPDWKRRSRAVLADETERVIHADTIHRVGFSCGNGACQVREFAASESEVQHAG